VDQSIQNAVKDHFEDEAREFDHLILRLIPHYDRMVEAMVTALPFSDSTKPWVIDLGCGTGTVARSVLESFPNAQIVCVDLAENMLTMAREKLTQYSQVSYVAGDFAKFEFQRNYHAVISSLALHHLVTDDDKKQFYRRIFDNLAPGGVFYNADVVLGSSDFLQETYMRRWIEFMRERVSDEEITSKWIPKYQAEDRPAELVKQLVWLAEIGFSDVDVIWKYYNFAVYGGRKA
jgi:tRNA (cmo5U34)-methyltransferase